MRARIQPVQWNMQVSSDHAKWARYSRFKPRVLQNAQPNSTQWYCMTLRLLVCGGQEKKHNTHFTRTLHSLQTKLGEYLRGLSRSRSYICRIQLLRVQMSGR